MGGEKVEQGSAVTARSRDLVGLYRDGVGALSGCAVQNTAVATSSTASHSTASHSTASHSCAIAPSPNQPRPPRQLEYSSAPLLYTTLPPAPLTPG